MTTSGFPITVQAGLEALAEAQTIVVPGYLRTTLRPDATALRELQRAARRGARVMSICTGAFALAHAGLLDGRRATTHWDSAEQFRRVFPGVHLEPNVLYVDEGSILTSAGVAAGLDLCLHVIRRDHGADLALQHRLDTRSSGLTATATKPSSSNIQSDRRCPGSNAPGSHQFDGAVEHITTPITVNDLARHVSVSPRTFARRFRSEIGTTPIQWLLAQRVLKAQQILECTDAPIDQVAQMCGFTDTASLRYHFRRALGTTPTSYRRTFASK